MRVCLAILFTCVFGGALVGDIVFWYQFKAGCEDYLKLAGDAPTIEKAAEFLDKAVDYMEENNLTSGNSAFVFKTPANDVGIWYSQAKGARNTVKNLIEQEKKESVPQLIKDNALMKIREVVLDQSRSGTSVTVPKRIAWFPNQWLILLWNLSFILGGIFWIVWIRYG